VCFGGGLFQNVSLVAALEEEIGMNQVSCRLLQEMQAVPSAQVFWCGIYL